MADHIRQELVIDALNMAVSRCRPKPGLIHHSDQGSQYVALGFGQMRAKSGISRSMGSTGVCWDNAVAETFFATLKKELVSRRSWPARHELSSEIFEFIEAFYAGLCYCRGESAVGCGSPATPGSGGRCSTPSPDVVAVGGRDG